MTRVKICGLTNRDDAMAAVEYGADALGFIGVKESPRYVSADKFYDIWEKSPFLVPRVIIVKTITDGEKYGTDIIQYYDELQGVRKALFEPHYPPGTWQPARIRCVRMKDANSLDEIRNHANDVAAFLLDAYHADKLGGSGESFNWELAVEAKKLTDKPIILAGGLTPDNVQDALEKVRPYAVDVASGVEESPGVKDHAKIRAFIRAVREWDLKHG